MSNSKKRKYTESNVQSQTKRFEALPMVKSKSNLKSDSDNIIQTLMNKFLNKLGHISFRSKQKEIILDVVKGKNVFLCMATGTGKSLCFQIAILTRNAINNGAHFDNKPAIGIVISPLIALMSDQVSKLQSKGISAVFWNSTLNTHQRGQIKYDLQIGKIDIVYTTPESLLSRTNGIKDLLIKYRKITTFCIDETHCVIMWGGSFRPSYFSMAASFKDFGNPPLIVCTATVSSSMKIDIIHNLKITNNLNEYIFSMNRPNIELNIEKLSNQKFVFQRAADVIGMMHKRYDLTKNSIIIFTGMIKTATNFYEYLRTVSDLDIVPSLFHSKIKKNNKEAILKDFMSGVKNVIVATSGFGMGIDKANVRCVIHLALPPNPEEWVQQIGRAGRDGVQSYAYLFTHFNDYFANFCVNKASKINIQKINNFLFDKFNVNKERHIGTLGKLYREMNGIPKEQKKNNMTLSDEEYYAYKKYTHSMKILERYGIIHKAGNYVYLLKKDLGNIDWKEIDDIDTKNLNSYLHMQCMVQQTECIRERLLLYFGEKIKQKHNKFSCCSYCNMIRSHNNTNIRK
ncbi:MAG: ATP-dependent DNA helicase RecQ [Colwellia sp.]|nr:ATP-dependent DNA helicase RecQ [Colwellia sp.]